MPHVSVRHAEPDDYEAMHRIMSAPGVAAGTLQLPLQSAEAWRKRLAEPPGGLFLLVACVEGEVVGNLGLETSPNRPRVRHAGSLGMAVRDDWQGRGVGSALLGAALDLADNWLNLTRIGLTVYVDNSAAAALYKRFGFEVEGTHRRHAFRNGGFVEAYTMARIRWARSAESFVLEQRAFALSSPNRSPTSPAAEYGEVVRRTREIRNTRLAGLRFRALLGREPKVELALA